MIQIFDVDRSLSSIGDRDVLKQTFGLDPIPLDMNYKKEFQTKKGDLITRSGMDEHFKEFLGKLFIKQKVKVNNDLFGVETEEIKTLMTPQAQDIGLKGIVLDSISGMGEAIRDVMIRQARFDQMTRDLWGKYGVRMGNIMTALRDIPTQVFITCHIDRVESDEGVKIEYPAIKGGQKTDAMRWFDVIVYNQIDDGQVFWQVTKTPQRPFIRSRTAIPEWDGQNLVEPNYMPVLRAYRKASTPLKMLVCGDSGTGKTYALQTMENYVQAFIEKAQRDKESQESGGQLNGTTAEKGS